MIERNLKILQSLPLETKVLWAEEKIREWYEHFNGMVYVAFSGGKDSTVLLDIVRGIYPEVPAVFVDTGLEYPEIRDFVKTIDNVAWLKPKMPFNKVIEKHGYPVVSKKQSCAITRYRKTKDPLQKHRRLNGWPNGNNGKISNKWQFLIDAPFLISDECCNIMKIKPIQCYRKKTGRNGLNGVMASESLKRKEQYNKYGCNSFDTKEPISRPISIWTDADIWQYIAKMKLPYSKIYDMGEKRTGCMFCMFGCHMEVGENRFQRMAKHHPKQLRYCLDNLGMKMVFEYLGIKYHITKPEMKQEGLF